MHNNQNQNKKQKNSIKIKGENILETLKDIGVSTGHSLKQDLIQRAPQEFVEQILGPDLLVTNRQSGEIIAGQSVEIDTVQTEIEENITLKQRLSFERRVNDSDKAELENKTNELKLQLNAVMQEVVSITSQTQELAKETQIAAMQAPVEPGIYHIFFFKYLLDYLQSFRKKIEDASVWLSALNKRASKKNMWGQNYKKSGAKYLLSSEHYIARSAG